MGLAGLRRLHRHGRLLLPLLLGAGPHRVGQGRRLHVPAAGDRRHHLLPAAGRNAAGTLPAGGPRRPLRRLHCRARLNAAWLHAARRRSAERGGSLPGLTRSLRWTARSSLGYHVPPFGDHFPMHRLFPAAGLVFAVFAFAACGGREEPMRTASLVLTRGRIHTLDPAHPEASAIAILGDRILKTGSDKEIAALMGPGTRKIDLQGKTVIPGLIDAHLHLAGIGEALENLDLKGIASPEEVVKRVEEAAARTAPGGWILGRGWDQNLWVVPEFPTAAMLDAVSGDHPVSLKRVDGHALWANSKALEAAGVTRTTPNPAGGRILHEAGTGAPSGILLDDAMSLVEGKIPPTTPQTQQRRIETAGRELLAVGITSVHDAGIDPQDVDLYMKMVEEGSLPVRVYAMVGGS